MNKTTKRILALLMTVTALLGLMVPAVSAETTGEANCKIVYDFDFRSHAGTNAFASENSISRQSTAYLNGNLNYKYNSGTMTSGQDLVKTLTYPTNSYGYEYIRCYTAEGDYLAITIKTPTVGTYSLSLYHGTTKSGASTSNIYILPIDTTDIASALAEAKAVGSVSYYNKKIGTADPASKTTAQSSEVMKTRM